MMSAFASTEYRDQAAWEREGDSPGRVGFYSSCLGSRTDRGCDIEDVVMNVGRRSPFIVPAQQGGSTWFRINAGMIATTLSGVTFGRTNHGTVSDCNVTVSMLSRSRTGPFRVQPCLTLYSSHSVGGSVSKVMTASRFQGLGTI